MPTPSENSQLFSREVLLTALLAILTFIAIFLSTKIVMPFFAPLTFAAAVAVATQRPFNATASYFSNKSVHAGVAALLVAVLVLVPVGLLASYAFTEGLKASQELQKPPEHNNALQSASQAPGHMESLKKLLRGKELQEQVRQAAAGVAEKGVQLVGGTVKILTQVAITVFLLYFFYRDGKQASERLRKLLPLSDDEARRLLERVSDSMLATVNGSLIVAFVQAVLAGTVYTLLGVPAALLCALATFFMALIPMFGTFAVWGPISLYLFLHGQHMQAFMLLGFGMCAIGMIDNLLYPYLVGDRMRMHTVVAFFAILGGIAVFGPAGLIVGPLVFSITTELLEIWWQRTRKGQSAEQPMKRKSANSSPAELLES